MNPDSKSTDEYFFIKGIFDSLKIYDDTKPDFSTGGSILQLDEDETPPSYQKLQNNRDMFQADELRLKLLNKVGFSMNGPDTNSSKLDSLFTKELLNNIGHERVYAPPQHLEGVLDLAKLVDIASKNPDGYIYNQLREFDSQEKVLLYGDEQNFANPHGTDSFSNSRQIRYHQSAAELRQHGLGSAVAAWLDNIVQGIKNNASGTSIFASRSGKKALSRSSATNQRRRW